MTTLRKPSDPPPSPPLPPTQTANKHGTLLTPSEVTAADLITSSSTHSIRHVTSLVGPKVRGRESAAAARVRRRVMGVEEELRDLPVEGGLDYEQVGGR